MKTYKDLTLEGWTDGLSGGHFGGYIKEDLARDIEKGFKHRFSNFRPTIDGGLHRRRFPKSESYEVDFDISTGSKTFYFETAEEPSSISIAPIILDGKTERIGDIIYTAELKAGSISEIPEGANTLGEIQVPAECSIDPDCINDENPCTAHTCNSGICESTDMADGSYCGVGLWCQSIVCVPVEEPPLGDIGDSCGIGSDCQSGVCYDTFCVECSTFSDCDVGYACDVGNSCALDTTLVGMWGFEGGSGTTAVDESANSNDGTIVGAAIERPIIASMCYEYATKAVADLCVVKDILKDNSRVCTVGAVKEVFSSGAPIQVTSLTERAAGQNKLEFDFVIANQGSVSKIYKEGVSCEGTRSVENKVKVEVAGIEGITCQGTDSEGYVNLQDGTKTIRCNVEIDSATDYEKAITIDLTYAVSDDISTTLMVKHTE